MATLTPECAIFYRGYGAFDFSNSDIHSIHHRGQLSMYLRPIGAKVPILGESYDSAQARLAASKA